MTKLSRISRPITSLFVILLFAMIFLMNIAQVSSTRLLVDRAISSESNELRRLRHFLLTSDAEQRAQRREKQDSYKRELVRQQTKRFLCSSR